MRLIESAWVLFGFSASALTAGWWQPAFIWAAVALALMGLLACLATALFQWTATERAGESAARMLALEQRVEALQKAQAYQALR